MEPFIILLKAIKKVPFLKYALAMVAIGSAIAIIKSFEINNYNIPIASFFVVLFFMLLLFIFSKIAGSKDKVSKNAGYILIYSTVSIICVGGILFTTSIFFDYPKPIYEYPFFKKNDTPNEKITVNAAYEKDKLPSNHKTDTKSYLQNKPVINEKSTLKALDNLIEISIQLDALSQGYDLITVNGVSAQVLASSTPLNPRILVVSNPTKNQFIEIITKNGDTCYINKILDKTDKQNFPIRFIPEYKSK